MARPKLNKKPGKTKKYAALGKSVAKKASKKIAGRVTKVKATRKARTKKITLEDIYNEIKGLRESLQSDTAPVPAEIKGICTPSICTRSAYVESSCEDLCEHGSKDVDEPGEPENTEAPVNNGLNLL